MAQTTTTQYTILRALIYEARYDAYQYGSTAPTVRRSRYGEHPRYAEVYTRLYQHFLQQRFAKLSEDEQNLLHAWNMFYTVERRTVERSR